MRAIVIGIGNALRTDDGVGEAVIHALERDGAMAVVALRACHQLTPELAVDLASADLVVFVDASAALPPGEVREEIVEAHAHGTPRSHGCRPADLLAEASRLFGRVPVAHLITVGAASVEVGADLTATVRARIPAVTERVRALVS